MGGPFRSIPVPIPFPIPKSVADRGMDVEMISILSRRGTIGFDGDRVAKSTFLAVEFM